MAKKQTKLATYRKNSQIFTVGSALAYGFVWVFASIFYDTNPEWVNKLGGVLIAFTIIGAVAMGLLFCAQPAKSSKKKK